MYNFFWTNTEVWLPCDVYLFRFCALGGDWQLAEHKSGTWERQSGFARNYFEDERRKGIHCCLILFSTPGSEKINLLEGCLVTIFSLDSKPNRTTFCACHVWKGIFFLGLLVFSTQFLLQIFSNLLYFNYRLL